MHLFSDIIPKSLKTPGLSALLCLALLLAPSLIVASGQKPDKTSPKAPAPTALKATASPKTAATNNQPKTIAPPKRPSRTDNRTTRREPLLPQIPKTDRHTPGKVFLEHADQLYYKETLGLSAEDQSQVLVGNVKFRRGDMFMFCDSARFYESVNSFDAFGNVRMEQGDTLFVYADELNYNGSNSLAILYANPGKKVRLINREVKLETDIFNYDMTQNVGFYNIGGVLTDKQNRLTSIEGEYYPDTKYAYFYTNVVLESKQNNSNLTMRTDSLIYNTATHIAQLVSPTEITNSDGVIYSSSGTYNTETGLADLYKRSQVVTRRGNTLTGDTLFYDRVKQYGEAFGNMILTDSARQSSLHGNYGYYDELRDSAFVTGRALAKEYSKGDTLYLHGDSITAYLDLSDSTRVTNAFHNVRFFRSDIQGLCDSLSITERDSLMYMYRAPVMWSDERQITGSIIVVHLNDSTVDWARLPRPGIVAEHIDEDCYNQISGNDLTAWFNDSTLRRLYVEGNVQLIMFPMESDSTYNKFAFVESSYMDSYFNGNQVERIHFWPETTSRITPLYLAKRNSYFLSKFAWYDDMRPFGPYDVFNVPESMRRLIEESEPADPETVQRILHPKTTPNPNAPKTSDSESADSEKTPPDKPEIDSLTEHNEHPASDEPVDNPEHPVADEPADNPEPETPENNSDDSTAQPDNNID